MSPPEMGHFMFTFWQLLLLEVHGLRHRILGGPHLYQQLQAGCLEVKELKAFSDDQQPRNNLPYVSTS